MFAGVSLLSFIDIICHTTLFSSISFIVYHILTVCFIPPNTFSLLTDANLCNALFYLIKGIHSRH